MKFGGHWHLSLALHWPPFIHGRWQITEREKRNCEELIRFLNAKSQSTNKTSRNTAPLQPSYFYWLWNSKQRSNYTLAKKKVSIIRNLCFSILSHLILQFLAVLSPNNGENSWEKNIQRSHWGLLSPAPLEHLSHSVITFSYSIPSLLAVSLDYKLLRKGYVCLSSLYILST